MEDEASGLLPIGVPIGLLRFWAFWGHLAGLGA